MKQIAFINNSLNDAPFAVVVTDKNKTTSFGISPTASAWANQANQQNYSVDDIKSNIDIMLYLSGFKTLTENEVESLSGIVNDDVILKIRKLLDEETKSFKLTIKSDPSEEINNFQPPNTDEDLVNELTRLSISDAPISYIDVEFKRDAIIYKAKAFRLDTQVASLRLEAKGARAIFDPDARGGVGAWRCPEDTPYGGQFTNRFGRGCTWGVSRRLGRAFTAFAGQDIGKISKLGSALEERGDQRLLRAGERANRRLDRRAERAARPPARERVAERLATRLESTAAGLRSTASRRAERRINKPTPEPKQPKQPKDAKDQLDARDQFFEELKKRNSGLSIEDATYVVDSRDPKKTGNLYGYWYVRSEDESDQDWLTRLRLNMGDNKDGHFIPVPEDQLEYVTAVSVDYITKPNNRDFRRSINQRRKKLAKEAAAEAKKTTRKERGTSPKKAPLAQRMAERAAAKAQGIRKVETSRKERGRKPRSTESRRERAAKLLARTATDVAKGSGTPKETWRQVRQARKNERSRRRNVSLPGNATAKFFAKTPPKKQMPDINTLSQQQQDDVRTAVQQAYDRLYDVIEKRMMDYIKIAHRRDRANGRKLTKFNSKPGNLDMDEVVDATQNTPVISSFTRGLHNNDAHNFQVLAEILENDDYSLIDELKPATKDIILKAAGIQVPTRQRRKTKPTPSPSAAPQAPTPTVTPNPPSAPTPPQTPQAPQAPTPPPPPKAPTPPPVNPNPQSTPIPSVPIKPTPPPASATPPTPKPDSRDLSIDGVEPAGSTWLGNDVSGLIRVEKAGGDPLFRDPKTNRYVDLSDNITIDNPAADIEITTFPPVSKTPVVKYPKKRAPINGVQKDREIFPGVSPTAFDSWAEAAQLWDPFVAEHKNQLLGFRTFRESLPLLQDGFDETKPVDSALAKTLQKRLIYLEQRPKYLTTSRSSGNYVLSQAQQDLLDKEIAKAREALTNYIVSGKFDKKIDEIGFPEWLFDLPVPSSPFDEASGFSGPGVTDRWLYTNYWDKTILSRPSAQLTLALILKDDDLLIRSYDGIVSARESLKSELESLLKQWRSGKSSSVIPRRIVQVGHELDAAERMIKNYFTNDTITNAVQKQKRAAYRSRVELMNRARERVELRESGQLKVGGKFNVEDLRPKEGVVRDATEIRDLVNSHKSPNLFTDPESFDVSENLPVLTPDEIEYYDQTQNAFLEEILPDGTKVTWGGGRSDNGSIAELFTAMELNGYNDPPVQVSREEFEALKAEKRENGKPQWFMMTRWLKQNSDRPDVSPTQMVQEYIEGTRWPVGAGGSAGGRGDNFAGGGGYTHGGYGDHGIIALVSADSRMTDRPLLSSVNKVVQKQLQEAAEQRHVNMTPKYPKTVFSTPTPITDDELEQLIDSLKANLAKELSSSFNDGEPRKDEARILAAAVLEHWLQLELSKIKGDNLTPEQIQFNERIGRMQTSIYMMDEAQLAILGGYDGYFSNTLMGHRSAGYSSDNWADHYGNNFDGQGTQVMWLNRTGLVVLSDVGRPQDAIDLDKLG